MASTVLICSLLCGGIEERTLMFAILQFWTIFHCLAEFCLNPRYVLFKVLVVVLHVLLFLVVSGSR